MANNYTETSFIITMRDNKEQQAVLDLLADLELMHCGDPDHENTCPDRLVHDLYADLEVDDYGIGFQAEADGDTNIWFHGEESVNVDQLAKFLGFLVRHFDMKPVSFMWADYCSKPRLGEQGGGAVFITQEETKWMSTYQWVTDQEAEYEISISL